MELEYDSEKGKLVDKDFRKPGSGIVSGRSDVLLIQLERMKRDIIQIKNQALVIEKDRDNVLKRVENQDRTLRNRFRGLSELDDFLTNVQNKLDKLKNKLDKIASRGI